MTIYHIHAKIMKWKQRKKEVKEYNYEKRGIYWTFKNDIQEFGP